MNPQNRLVSLQTRALDFGLAFRCGGGGRGGHDDDDTVS